MAESKQRVDLWVMLVLSVFAWSPATHPGYWQALDGFLPIFNSITLKRIADVASAPDLWRGGGVGAFLIPQLFFRLGLAPTLAVRLTFVVMLLAAAIGIYYWLADRLGSRGAALAGLSYLLLPPLLTTIYVRGRLADALLLALLPWTLATMGAFARAASVRQRLFLALLTILLLLWIWLTQAGLALFATLLLLGYALWVERNRLACGIVLVGSLAGAATLWPVRSLMALPSTHFYDHFVYLFQLLGNHWQVAPSIAGWQDQAPLQLGLFVLMTSIVAIWLWAIGKPALSPVTERLLRFGGFGSLLLIALSLTFSVPMWQLSGADRLLEYPWQITLIAAPLLVVLPAALPTLLPSFGETPLWSALLLLALANSTSNLTTDFTSVEPPLQPVAVVGNNQFVLLETQIDTTALPTMTLTVGWQALQPLTFDYNLFLQVRSDETAQATTLVQFDGQPLPERPATSWRPGEIFTATYSLNLPNSITSPPVYLFGFYDWRDGARLPITLPGNGGRDDKLVLYEP